MSYTVTGAMAPQVSFQVTQSSGFISGQLIPITFSGNGLKANYGSGSAADKIAKISAFTLTFVASTPQTIDLTSLPDVFGNAAAVSFGNVHTVAIRMNSTTDGAEITLTPNASNGWDKMGLGLILPAASTTNPAGAFFVISAPNTTGFVVDSTHKSLDLTPSAHAFTVDFELTGY